MTASATARLAPDTLCRLCTGAPGYDRAALAVSVLHLGPGAFFRAHQADYFDKLNALDPRWGIHAVALRTPGVANALSPQDGLYTLVTLQERTTLRVIGSLLSVAFAGDAGAFAPFTSPDLKLVTLTVTEKGYCLNADGWLDLEHPDIRNDLSHPEAPVSAPGVLVQGLRARRSAGLKPPLILPCDNLANNGEKLHAALVDLARPNDPELAAWINDHVEILSCMVDAITPATDDATRNLVRDTLGMDDAWPVQREGFTSWVIERTKDPRMPALDRVGAVFTDDVPGHEQAKLRLLNGAHSTLAYLGLACGHETVADAMTDQRLRPLIDDLMRQEIAPSLKPPEGLDLDIYRRALLERFTNPAIRHHLSQIAWDGSKKLPIRLIATLSDNLRAGRSIERLSLGIAAWMRFIVRRTRAGDEIVDPMAAELKTLAMHASDDPETDCAAFLSIAEIFPDHVAANTRAMTTIASGYSAVMRLEADSVRSPA